MPGINSVANCSVVIAARRQLENEKAKEAEDLNAPSVRELNPELNVINNDNGPDLEEVTQKKVNHYITNSNL